MNVQLLVVIMFGALIVLLSSGLPLVFTLGSLALFLTYFLWTPDALMVVALQTFHVMSTYSFVAIPLFIFMATMLQKSGVIEDLFSAVHIWTGRFRGSLAIGVVFVSTLMAAMTGIVGAAVASMGMLALPEMLKRNYSKTISLGSIAAGGTLGILIPPSVITVVYAVTAGVSIGKMFMGGVFPGLLLSSLFVLYISIRCFLQPTLAPPAPPEERKARCKVKLLKLKSLTWPILLIIGVIGSIYTGIATPTEAAGVGALGSIFSAAFYRRLNWKNLKDSAYTTLTTTAMILWITIGARCFISVFSATGGINFVKSLLLGLEVNRYVILIIIQLILILLGMFLDEIGIILLCTPIFLPIIKALGFDPIWFGILFLVNAQMDYITPPFGYTLFYLKGVAPSGISMGDIYRSIIPFVLLQATGLALCIIFPQIILFLPHSMK